MGCCSSANEPQLYRSDISIVAFANDCISKNIELYGMKQVSEFDKNTVDKAIVNLGGLTLNALAFSIVIGNLSLIRYLHESLGSSFLVSQKLLQSQDYDIIELIITYFHEDILAYLIPHYLSSAQCEDVIELDHTICFQSQEFPKIRKFVHPMLYAAEIGNIAFILFVLKYFNKKTVPYLFDINAVDEDTGENCGLIACKTLNHELILILHKNKCNFLLKNKRRENAIQILLHCCRGCGKMQCLAMVVFLNEIVGVDVTENYEETLLIAKDEKIVEYIEEQLRKRGLFITKRMIEEKYNISFSLCNIQFSEEVTDIIDINSPFSLISSIGGHENNISISQD